LAAPPDKARLAAAHWPTNQGPQRRNSGRQFTFHRLSEAVNVRNSRVIILIVIAAAIGAFFYFDLNRYFSLDYLKAQQGAIQAQYQAAPALTIAIFALVYIAVTGLSLPGAAILTLLAGALFGLVVGTLVVSFASTIGATLAFLTARFILRDSVQAKFGDKLKPINDGVAKEGAFYLFALRLVPAFPFFIVNLVMGLTPIRVWTYFWVSQVGMLAGTIAFVNAGTELAKLTSLKGILSPTLIASFAVLGIFPLLAKAFLNWLKARRVYGKWNAVRPSRFDRNIVVIGAGSAGLVTSYIAAAVKAKVTLIERHRMGGDCLNTGCVPSKALIRSAKFVSEIKRHKAFGMANAEVNVDFAAVMERVQSVVKAIEPHDSVERYSGLGVECMTGEARITTPWTVEVKTESGVKTLTTRAIVIAAGAAPVIPPIPGLADVGPLSSDTVWNLRELPPRLIVLGGGPIGCELAQCFARLGSKVTQVEMAPRLLVREDADVSQLLVEAFTAEGIRVLLGHTAKEVVVVNGEKTLLAEKDGVVERIGFDAILCAVGRRPNVTGYGLEGLGIGTTRTRTVETNDYLQTIYPNIYACGDVAGPFQLTHTAAHQAWYAAVNALFGRFKMFKADYRVIPWTTFTEPEVARVGLNEQEAKEQKIDAVVSQYGIDDLDRAIADGNAHGFVKVLTARGTDKILGVTIVGDHAGDLLAEFVLAMRHGIGLNKILGTIHTYPTLAEANKFAAGVWKRSTVTRGQHRFAEIYQSWMRGEASFAAVLLGLQHLRDKTPAYDATVHP
jgi:dihydrolipoamide dehydrogenase